MKIIKSLLCLFLIPFALAFMSCNNEIPEELIIEFIPYDGEGGYTIDDVDYLVLKLCKEPDGGGEENNQVTNIPPVFEGNLYRVKYCGWVTWNLVNIRLKVLLEKKRVVTLIGL